jgi:anti-sigma-K factor RskA
MDINSYIESGMLELYASNLLSEKEKAEVEQLLLQYPELKKELNAIEQSLFEMDKQFAVAPSAGLKSKIQKQLHFTKVIQIAQWQYKWLVAASISLFIAVAALLSVLMYQFKSSEATIASLNQQIDSMSTSLGTLAKVYQKYETISDYSVQKVVMSGTKSKEEKAIIYWNPETQQLIIDNVNLPALGRDKIFQLWAIVDGKPVDAGIFDNQADFASLKQIAKAQAFAVTIEPNGGSESPSLESMCLYTQL